MRRVPLSLHPLTGAPQSNDVTLDDVEAVGLWGEVGVLRGRDLVKSCFQLACDEGLDDLAGLVCLRARLSNPFVNRVFKQVILAMPSSS